MQKWVDKYVFISSRPPDSWKYGKRLTICNWIEHITQYGLLTMIAMSLFMPWWLALAAVVAWAVYSGWENLTDWTLLPNRLGIKTNWLNIDACQDVATKGIGAGVGIGLFYWITGGCV